MPRASVARMRTEKLPDPKLDVVFKMLFAREDAHDLLIALLNDMLRTTEPAALRSGSRFSATTTRSCCGSWR